MNPSDKSKKLVDLIHQFKNAMLITHDRDRLDARPMAIAKAEDGGGLWFVTDRQSSKVMEINASTDVGVTMQGSDQFVYLSADASVIDDRVMLEKLWQDSWRAWFPDGVNDPAIVLLHIIPRSGEYWDNSGLSSWGYAKKSGFAFFRGEPPLVDDEINSKVNLQDR
ncbi:MAG TPA: general stress protein [Planctomycetaceae bacterium]|nr:general stress protein [Planctomycetaceae bacterium]